jgi:hypothetical protein
LQGDNAARSAAEKSNMKESCFIATHKDTLFDAKGLSGNVPLAWHPKKRYFCGRYLSAGDKKSRFPLKTYSPNTDSDKSFSLKYLNDNRL